jgi:hypothetical protein
LFGLILIFKPFKNPIQTKIENQGLYLIVQSLNYVKLSIILSSPVNGNLMYSFLTDVVFVSFQIGANGKICSGNGKCKGAGTRKGNGQCACDKGKLTQKRRQITFGRIKPKLVKTPKTK